MGASGCNSAAAAAGGGVDCSDLGRALPRTYLEVVTGRGTGEAAAVPRRAPRAGVGADGGVRATPPSSLAASSESGSVDTAAAAEPYSPRAGGGHRSIGDLQPHLLWWRDGKGPDRSIHSAVGPGIGEGEMSEVHFIIHSGTLFQKHLKNRLVTSTDTDQWTLVLLAMSCGHIE
ncbi:unnamed protein product, partial [Sphacelaria rigidula]